MLSHLLIRKKPKDAKKKKKEDQPLHALIILETGSDAKNYNATISSTGLIQI